jgi:hypothetical protein
VFLLLVAVVGQDRPELGVARRIHALVVPVDRFQLFHDGNDGPMPVHGLRFELIGAFMKRTARLRHAFAPWCFILRASPVPGCWPR